MSEYTPTTDEMRFAWSERVNKHNQEGSDEFDRWLSAVKREAAARALEEAAESYAYIHAVSRASLVYSWLRARAAEYRKVVR